MRSIQLHSRKAVKGLIDQVQRSQDDYISRDISRDISKEIIKIIMG